jgi:hypothetical protein
MRMKFLWVNLENGPLDNHKEIENNMAIDFIQRHTVIRHINPDDGDGGDL